MSVSRGNVSQPSGWSRKKNWIPACAGMAKRVRQDAAPTTGVIPAQAGIQFGFF